MRTKKTIKLVINSLIVTVYFITTQDLSGQTWGGSHQGDGTNKPFYVINAPNHDHWAFLRLQTSSDRAWSMVNEGTDNDAGSLWWGYSSNGAEHSVVGDEKMRLYPNGTLKTQGKLISGADGGGLTPDYIDSGNTRGLLVNAGTDNAFFGLVNRVGGDNDYNTVLYFGDDLHDDLEFRSYFGGELMRVTGDGNIGIGTNSPEAKLHVLGNIRVDGGQYMSHGPIILRPDTDGTGDDSILFLNNQEQEHMRIDEEGRVGIGTANPEAMLHVSGKLISGTDGGGLTQDYINWDDTRGLFVGAGNDNAFFGLINRTGASVGDDNYNTVLYFGDNNDDDLEFRSYYGELMRVTGDGNVGIGTSTPVEKLEVSGTIKATSFVSSAASFPDYVFADDYNITPLSELETYVTTHKHLPNMPSEKEVVQQGLNLPEVVTKSVENIETIYLHLIRMEKEIKALQQENTALKQQLQQDR